jgi:hypothetical protein
MIVVVTGGRRSNRMQVRELNAALDLFTEQHGVIDVLIEGGAEGTDRACRLWARNNNVHVATVEAEWQFNTDNLAGNRRNTAMCKLKPDYGIVFPGRAGTADMKTKLKHFGIPVWDAQLELAKVAQ